MCEYEVELTRVVLQLFEEQSRKVGSQFKALLSNSWLKQHTQLVKGSLLRDHLR